ncbi:hypothetical protein DFH06DRAFT_465238 [Mycena polygramma]|nr:hypothetical protein DFH06DRAFT_465238 [Mycena polygramma]
MRRPRGPTIAMLPTILAVFFAARGHTLPTCSSIPMRSPIQTLLRPSQTHFSVSTRLVWTFRRRSYRAPACEKKMQRYGSLYCLALADISHRHSLSCTTNAFHSPASATSSLSPPPAPTSASRCASSPPDAALDAMPRTRGRMLSPSRLPRAWWGCAVARATFLQVYPDLIRRREDVRAQSACLTIYRVGSGVYAGKIRAEVEPDFRLAARRGCGRGLCLAGCRSIRQVGHGWARAGARSCTGGGGRCRRRRGTSVGRSSIPPAAVGGRGWK